MMKKLILAATVSSLALPVFAETLVDNVESNSDLAYRISCHYTSPFDNNGVMSEVTYSKEGITLSGPSKFKVNVGDTITVESESFGEPIELCNLDEFEAMVSESITKNKSNPA